MIARTEFDRNSQIGCFSRLTNSYCIVAYLEDQGFYSTFDELLSNYIPVVQTSVYNSFLVGTLTAGNKNGLLVPNTATDQELQHLRNSLPQNVIIKRVEEKLSALGNVIACNDHVALIHPEIDRETEYLIEDVLQVEVFRHSISTQALVGTYSAFNNIAGVVCPGPTADELNELSNLLQIPLTVSSVNRGSPMVGSGIVLNDFSLFCGAATTGPEYSVISNLIKPIEDYQNSLSKNPLPAIVSHL